MKYKMMKIDKDVWDIIKSESSKLDMTIIGYIRYLVYKNVSKGK